MANKTNVEKIRDFKPCKKGEFREFSKNGKHRKLDFDDYVIGYSNTYNNGFLALTTTKSKTFKTEKGARRFLENLGCVEVKKKTK